MEPDAAAEMPASRKVEKYVDLRRSPLRLWVNCGRYLGHIQRISSPPTQWPWKEDLSALEWG